MNKDYEFFIDDFHQLLLILENLSELVDQLQLRLMLFHHEISEVIANDFLIDFGLDLLRASETIQIN